MKELAFGGPIPPKVEMGKSELNIQMLSLVFKRLASRGGE